MAAAQPLVWAGSGKALKAGCSSYTLNVAGKGAWLPLVWAGSGKALKAGHSSYTPDVAGQGAWLRLAALRDEGTASLSWCTA